MWRIKPTILENIPQIPCTWRGEGVAGCACIILHAHVMHVFLQLVSACVCHGRVSLQTKASRRTAARVINSSDWYDELKDSTVSFSPSLAAPSPPPTALHTHTPMHRQGVRVLLRPHAPGVWSLLSGVVHIKTQDAFRGSENVHQPRPSLPPNAEVSAFAPTRQRCPSSHGSKSTTWWNNGRRKLLYGQQTVIIHLLWRVNLTYEETSPSPLTGDGPLMQPRWEINDSVAWYMGNDSAKKKKQKYNLQGYNCKI